MTLAALLLVIPLSALALVLALLGIARALDRLAAAVRER